MILCNELFISVIIGVIASFIVISISHWFNIIIVPWYKGIVYEGLDINGQWIETHNYEDLFTQVSEISLKQNGHYLTGEIVLSKKKIDDNKIIELKSFKIKGMFYNNILNITCINNNKQFIGAHNYLLKIKYDGRQIEGIKVFYDVGLQNIISTEISWFRKEN